MTTNPGYKHALALICLMADPIAVVIAGAVTVWLAVISNDGLVTDDYYKQGLAVNQTLQRDHQASSLGLEADVMRSGKACACSFRARKAGAARPGLKLIPDARRDQDQTVALVEEGQGFYSGKLAGTWLGAGWSIEDPAGQWRLHGEWLADSGGTRLKLEAEK